MKENNPIATVIMSVIDAVQSVNIWGDHLFLLLLLPFAWTPRPTPCPFQLLDDLSNNTLDTVRSVPCSAFLF